MVDHIVSSCCSYQEVMQLVKSNETALQCYRYHADDIWQALVQRDLTGYPLDDYYAPYKYYSEHQDNIISELKPSLVKNNGSEGHTPLTFAVYQGWEILAEKLLATRRYGVFHKVRQNMNLMQLAVLSENPLMVKKILELPEAEQLLFQTDGYRESALHTGAGLGNLEILSLLLDSFDAKSHVNDEEMHNKNLLRKACHDVEDDDTLLPVIQLLVSVGADITESQYGLGHVYDLVKHKCYKTLDFLLDNGLVLKHFSSAEHIIEDGQTFILEKVAANGFQLEKGEIPTCRLVETILNSDDKTASNSIESCLQQGAKINYQDIDTRSIPLHMAVQRGHHDTVLKLVQLKAIVYTDDIQQIHDYGWQDVMEAVKNSQSEYTQSLYGGWENSAGSFCMHEQKTPKCNVSESEQSFDSAREKVWAKPKLSDFIDLHLTIDLHGLLSEEDYHNAWMKTLVFAMHEKNVRDVPSPEVLNTLDYLFENCKNCLGYQNEQGENGFFTAMRILHENSSYGDKLLDNLLEKDWLIEQRNAPNNQGKTPFDACGVDRTSFRKKHLYGAEDLGLKCNHDSQHECAII